MSAAEIILGPLWRLLGALFGDVTLQDIVAFLRATSIVLSALFFFFIFIVEGKLKRLKIAMEGKLDPAEALSLSRMPPKGAFQESWDKIIVAVELRREADYRNAVIEADKLFEDIIKRLGLPNADVALNQKKITSEHLSNIAQITEAHNVKTKLVSNPNFHITQEQARQFVAMYAQAFKEWGVLE